MAFCELMSKYNLLGGRYSVPPTCPPSPPPNGSTTTSPARTSPSPSPKRKRTNIVASVLPKNNRIHTNTGFMLIEERDPETNENVDSPSSQNDLGDLMAKITKQRRMVERLKDPIVVKTQNRKRKTNLNAFKSKFLTLKKKIGALQMLKSSCCWSKIIYRIPHSAVAKPSKMAGKYMCYGSGEMSDLFFKLGIQFNASKMYKLANNYNYI